MTRRPCPHPNKVAHPSASGADIHLAVLIRKGYRGLRVYLCPCGAWHVGRKRKWVLPRRRITRSAANRRR